MSGKRIHNRRRQEEDKNECVHHQDQVDEHLIERANSLLRGQFFARTGDDKDPNSGKENTCQR